ncbi:MAG: hypothetical protein HOD49_11035, partial [Anaerolineae bacterium]|nr:hypothetical protein [Anaerolineae bacterium]
GVFFILFSLFIIGLLILFGFALWKTEKLKGLKNTLISLRAKLRYFSWIFALIILTIPLWFLQYTLWGLVFVGIYFRLFFWLLIIIILAILLTKDDEKLISFSTLLLSILLSGTSFTLASVFSNVTDYPFNLYWSDGNRLWDYSIMFGRYLYNYPADRPLNAFISSGRQFLWGLPFLFPNTSILFNRFWSALVLSLPYVVLGWAAFKTRESKKSEILFLSFWAFLFLNQGPIYTPLVFSAILVAIVWERPLWLAIPAIAVAGYYAEITRYTWEFAPAIWAGMLSLNGSKLKGERLVLRDWGRAIILAIAGVSIWYLYPIIQNTWQNRTDPVTGLGNAIVGTVSSAQSATSAQPLLWSRLFPSDTYPEGILGGLLIAILPLTILLFYSIKKKYWQPSLWQKLAILGALLPFWVVGIIISTKIGGGNNLHNLDMFLIDLLFVAAIMWRNSDKTWFSQPEKHPIWLQGLLILLIAIPALPSLLGLRPKLSLTEAEINQVKILADAAAVATLPPTEEINDALWYIRHAIKDTQAQGEILFIDQRQLLTFGYVPKIPLVPEYEKKRMMNEAMSSNAAYFKPYYEDLAAHRFSLIITEPLKIDIKDEEGSFAAENDLWAVWVAAPTLCYYEPLETLRSVYIQLLVPREEALDCSAYLP